MCKAPCEFAQGDLCLIPQTSVHLLGLQVPLALVSGTGHYGFLCLGVDLKEEILEGKYELQEQRLIECSLGAGQCLST